VTYIKYFFKKLVRPLSQNEDEARHEFILNILLIASIGLSVVAFVINLTKGLMGLSVAVSAVMVFIPLSFFVSLYFLSRKGFFLTASYCLLITLFSLASYEIYSWGADLPSALLTYVLVIVMAGILISTRLAFVTTIGISFMVIIVSYLQMNKLISSNLYWKNVPISMADFIAFVIIILIIATVSWLSNREIEKSLARARRSEAELKKERDLLEVTVEKKTRELKEAQVEKMAQLYRFAEFGRLSSGLYHDLVNSLNAVSLNMEKVKKEYSSGSAVSEAEAYVDKAVIATRKMEDFVIAVRKQLMRQENNTVFSLNVEIQHVVDVLAYKAKKVNVSLRFLAQQNIEIFGDAVKFNQVVLNLIANAIEAYLPFTQSTNGSLDASPKGEGRNREVLITLEKAGDVIILFIQDHGVGIAEEHTQKIFEAFFTTKTEGQGIGIGLSLTKRIVEKDFGGTIDVMSNASAGTVFTVRFSQKKNE
jgi:signal transduction histidine kinase